MKHYTFLTYHRVMALVTISSKNLNIKFDRIEESIEVMESKTTD